MNYIFAARRSWRLNKNHPLYILIKNHEIDCQNQLFNTQYLRFTDVPLPPFLSSKSILQLYSLCTFWSLIPKIVHSRRSFRNFYSYTDLSDDEIPMEDIIQQSEDNIQAIKKSPIRSPLKIPKGRYGKRKIRCKKCEGCTSEDCGVCNYCLYVNFGHPLPLFMGRWAPGFLYRTALGLLRTINLFSLYLVCQHCKYNESSFTLSDLNLAFLACPSSCKQFSPRIYVL